MDIRQALRQPRWGHFLQFYSERPRGPGFRSVNPAERWREILATPRVRDSPIWIQPQGVFRFNPTPGCWISKKLRHNYPICVSTDDVLSIGSAEKQCLQTGCVCDVVEIPQWRMATATSQPPARDIRDTMNPLRGFDQSAMLTSYRVWDYSDQGPGPSHLGHSTWGIPPPLDQFLPVNKFLSGILFLPQLQRLALVHPFSVSWRRPPPSVHPHLINVLSCSGLCWLSYKTRQDWESENNNVVRRQVAPHYWWRTSQRRTIIFETVVKLEAGCC